MEDQQGEWIELYNPGPDPVNLKGWSLADLDQDRHAITQDLWVQPGAYLVLARQQDPGLNGGVSAGYSYGNDLQLANSRDELLLQDPQGREVDRVI